VKKVEGSAAYFQGYLAARGIQSQPGGVDDVHRGGTTPEYCEGRIAADSPTAILTG
jgi:hypothetical protein